MSATYYGENKILNSIFTKQDISSFPDTWYIGLSTTPPNESGGNVTEPIGNGYSRVAVPNTTEYFSTSTVGATDNIIQISFPVATGTWGTVAHVLAYDSQTDGNLWFYEALQISESVTVGKVVQFPAHSLIIKNNN